MKSKPAGPCGYHRVAVRAVLLAAAGVVAAPDTGRAYDVSAPVILQAFDDSWSTLTNRMPDIFAAGYGGLQTPPPGRADSGNQSVGYDIYDRFDLGGPGNPTLYGTLTGVKALVNATHTMGGSFITDFSIGHNGFSNSGSVDGNGNSFVNAGGYPGFVMSVPGNVDGDFNSAYDTSTQNGRLAGLDSINLTSNYQFIRNPVNAGDPRNLPAGTTAAFGRLANQPDPNNAQYYPDTSLQPISIFDPKTNTSDIKVYPFNLAQPNHGTAVPENAMGYLMRNAQYMVQVVGVDGFRLDATKNMNPVGLDYFDRAVYRSSFRTLLNGQQEQIFSYGEYYDGSVSNLAPMVQKSGAYNADGSLADVGTVHYNRDTLDFPLFFAMQQNLSGNGYQNDWRNVHNAALDYQMTGLHNGSAGVHFVQSADNGSPYLSNVAYAYTMMLPGNSVVYTNGKNFGSGRDFPQDGRGDALGGVYGNAIPTLVDIRNRYGRGDYTERYLDQNNFAYERQGSAIVLLNNQTNGGYDSRTISTSFAPGTPLIELTGNAASPTANPFGDIPQLLVVNGDQTVNIRFLHNASPGYNNFTGAGYLIYGLPTPQGNLSLTNVAQVMKGSTPSASDPNVAYLNGTSRVNDVDVVKSNSFQVQLQTNAVNLLGFFRDHPADGDNALIKVDGGIDVTGSGLYTTPNSVQYGYGQFTTNHTPGYFTGDGNGYYAQTIDTRKLSQGYHYIEVIAFRHRDDAGPPVYSDWKQTIYVDTAPEIAAVQSFNPITPGVSENRTLLVKSTDQQANNMHVLFDLPANLSNSDILGRLGSRTQTNQIDTDLFSISTDQLTNNTHLTDGNHVATVVSFKPDGSYNIQRFAGLFTSTIYGAGLGDVNFDDIYSPADISQFGDILHSNNSLFNPAADLNGDGVVDNTDLSLLGQRLQAVNADSATMQAYYALAAAATPEPASLLLLASGGLMLLARRRKHLPRPIPSAIRQSSHALENS